jgi:type III secretion protein W
MGVSGGSGVSQPAGDSVIRAMKEAGKARAAERVALQEESSEDMRTALSEMINPFAVRLKKRQTLKSRRKGVSRKSKTGDSEESKRTTAIGKIKQIADKYQKKNPELKKRILEMLREYIKPGDSKEDILRKVQEFYGDVSLADEALDFLNETTGGELKEAVEDAQKDLNERFDREIKSGKNIGKVSREFSEKGLGTPTALRDMYRDITGNPREPKSMFEELSRKFPYNKLKVVIRFLMNSIGSDLRSKGPSIPSGFLHRLFSEVRTLQMILGVYRFFSGRMNLIAGLFSKRQVAMPVQINFESLSKIFMQLSTDRYPSSERILRLSKMLGIQDKLLAKIIIFTQFRDAIREVDPNRIFRSIQHRYELYQAIIEALEELEDELEMEEGNEEDNEEDKG